MHQVQEFQLCAGSVVCAFSSAVFGLGFILRQAFFILYSPQGEAVWYPVVRAAVPGWKRLFRPKPKPGSHCFDLGHVPITELVLLPLMVLGHVVILEWGLGSAPDLKG